MTIDWLARYEKAESVLPHTMHRLVHNPLVMPTWIDGTDTFWYRRTFPAGSQFVIVDPNQGSTRPAFDHERLAHALTTAAGVAVDAAALPVSAISLQTGVVSCAIGGSRVEVSLDGYVARLLPVVHTGEVISPDGRWAVGVEAHNVYLRALDDGSVRQLTTDGTEGYTYATAPDPSRFMVMQQNMGAVARTLVRWSPDSTRFVTHRLDSRHVERMPIVRSAPRDNGRPELLNLRYALVGDEHVPMATLHVFDVATGAGMQMDCEPIVMELLSLIALERVWWDADSAHLYVVADGRAGRTSHLYRLDAVTGHSACLVKEASEASVQHGPVFTDCLIRVLDSGEVIWWSDRSGWGHLYRYGPSGACNAITSGDWIVRKLVSVDADRREVVFTAGGRSAGTDPYLQQLCAVSLAGGPVHPLTDDDLDHEAFASPSGRYIVDVMSRWDVPSTSVVRGRDGTVVLAVEEADATALYATGWLPPERVTVKAADGATDLCGVIYRPWDFDPDQQYPVLEEIYPGPQMTCAPIRFPLAGGVGVAERAGAQFAALGFVVVAIDGRGTPLRSKQFQDHARLADDDDFISDHVAALRQLATQRPWMDLERVGIFGHSGGGFASTRALLREPDFYKVAVSSAGDHDDRCYHAWWGERYYGHKHEFDFDKHANDHLAVNLKGKLLLAHGDTDDNVPIHLTLQLVEALIRANKDFDLLVIPNADHSMLNHAAYWYRRRWDYFVRHLAGATPPDYRIHDVQIDAEMLTRSTWGHLVPPT